MTYDHVRFWHLALFAATRHFVRYWTKADKVSFWLAEVCPLMTQSGHRVGLTSMSALTGPHWVARCCSPPLDPTDITNCNHCADHIALQHFVIMYGVQAIALVLRKRLRRL